VGKEHLVYYIPYKVRSKNQPSNNCLGRDGISNFNLNTDTSYKCNLREKLTDPLDGHTYWDFRTSSCQSMVVRMETTTYILSTIVEIILIFFEKYVGPN
jgi:hypothetical protein